MGPTPVYGARAEKPLQNADFAMKQTNICRLSGDIIICYPYVRFVYCERCSAGWREPPDYLTATLTSGRSTNRRSSAGWMTSTLPQLWSDELLVCSFTIISLLF